MASFNKIILVGNLTRDPELKSFGSDNKVCKLGLASSRNFKNKSTGQNDQEVCFIDADVWGFQAENSAKYLSKGSPVLVEGRLKFDQWKDSDGKTKTKHSITVERIVFLASRSATNDAEHSEVEEIPESMIQSFKDTFKSKKNNESSQYDSGLPF